MQGLRVRIPNILTSIAAIAIPLALGFTCATFLMNSPSVSARTPAQEKVECTGKCVCAESGLSASCKCTEKDETETCTCRPGNCNRSGSCCKATGSGIQCSTIECGGVGLPGTRLWLERWNACEQVRPHENVWLQPASFSSRNSIVQESRFGIVEVSNPHGAPVGISRITYELSPSSFGKAQFRMENRAGQRIVAYELWWDVYMDDVPWRTPQFADYWIATEGPIGVGESIDEDSTLQLKAKAPITRIVLTIAYLELADGTRIGPDADSFKRELDSRRMSIVDVYRAALAAYDSGGINRLQTAISIEQRDDVFQIAAKKRIGEKLRSGGIESAVSELRRLALKSS